MKKNKKLLVAGIIALVAVIGIGLYAYADSRDDSTSLNTGSSSIGTATTLDQQTTTQTTGISAKEAKEKALSSAESKYGIKRSTVRDLETDREYEGGTYIWEVTFDARDKNNKLCEFEYHVTCEDGKITHHHKEYEGADDLYENEDADDHYDDHDDDEHDGYDD